jgi:hypothetical protein
VLYQVVQQNLETFLAVADAANLFDESFKRDDLIECGCNTHARRYFKKALDAGDNRAALPYPSGRAHLDMSRSQQAK